jgi:hypothetical protein
LLGAKTISQVDFTSEAVASEQSAYTKLGRNHRCQKTAQKLQYSTRSEQLLVLQCVPRSHVALQDSRFVAKRKLPEDKINPHNLFRQHNDK